MIWEMGKDPNIRIKVITAADELTSKIKFEVRQNLANNPKVREVFPKLQPYGGGNSWGTGDILVNRKALSRDPTLGGSAVLSTGVGGRADLMIFDDVVSFRNAVYYPSLRETVKEAVRSVWLNLLTPNGRAIYIGTPWHTEDLTSELEKNSDWHLWKKPAINPDKIAVPKGATPPVLWPQRWSVDALMKRRGSIGERAFSRQFLLEPLSPGEQTFSPLSYDRLQLQGAYTGAISPEQALDYFGWLRNEPVPIQRTWGWPLVAGVDLASSLNQKAAWNVITVAAVAPDGRRFIMGVERWKGRFPETIKRIKRIWNFFRS